MKRLLIFTGCWLLLMAGSMRSSAQTLAPTVVSSSGDVGVNVVLGSLHWTLGEPAVEIYQNGNILTQGFHQLYYDVLVSVGPEPPAGMDVLLYPNPTVGEVTVAIHPLPPGLTLDVFNLLGQQVLAVRLTQEKETIYLDRLGPGVYLFVIRNNDFIYRTIKVEKFKL